MSLIKSISGIRGTIGGKPGDNLSPIDIVECSAGFGEWVKSQHDKPTIIIGRDGRITGEWVQTLVMNTLVSQGISVIDLGLSTTPTVEMAVPKLEAQAGIVITASHNPKHWNALKFLNDKGEFISAEEGQHILKLIQSQQLNFAGIDEFGTYQIHGTAIEEHVDAILALDVIHVEQIQNANFKVVVDCINSTGALAMPVLLDALAVEYVLINETLTGKFAHNPEPLPKNLQQLSEAVVRHKADLGIALDPDVDRLALVSEDGSFFGEEYTLVAAADYILSRQKGNTVSNLSSSRALRDITEKHGGKYYAAAVGEVNVVQMMKDQNALIGGEGNGGVIYPALHYGRDALVGVAFILSLLSERDIKMSALRNSYSSYEMIKDKIDLSTGLELENIFARLKNKFHNEEINEIDGLKIDFKEGWVHMRKSNTEPIVRIYAEAKSVEKAGELIAQVKSEIPSEKP